MHLKDLRDNYTGRLPEAILFQKYIVQNIYTADEKTWIICPYYSSIEDWHKEVITDKDKRSDEFILQFMQIHTMK